ncbi:MAG: hypothetical protein ACM3ML_27940 [Micromonosporaceae bacterium]
MEIFGPDDLPVVLEIGKAQIRSSEAGGMTVTFYRLPAAADARPLLQGLPGGKCQCPHWGYVISGKLRIHTASGPHDVLAGQAFHVEPGHAPEAVEDTEMFEVSPTSESREVWAYLEEASRALQEGA